MSLDDMLSYNPFGHCIRTYMHKYLSTYIYINIHKHISLYIHIYMYICISLSPLSLSLSLSLASLASLKPPTSLNGAHLASSVVLMLGDEVLPFLLTYPRPLINKHPPLNRDCHRGPDLKALKRSGFMNHGSTLPSAG